MGQYVDSCNNGCLHLFHRSPSCYYITVRPEPECCWVIRVIHRTCASLYGRRLDTPTKEVEPPCSHGRLTGIRDLDQPLFWFKFALLPMVQSLTRSIDRLLHSSPTVAATPASCFPSLVTVQWTILLINLAVPAADTVSVYSVVSRLPCQLMQRLLLKPIELKT